MTLPNCAVYKYLFRIYQVILKHSSVMNYVFTDFTKYHCFLNIFENFICCITADSVDYFGRQILFVFAFSRIIQY